ncbi:protein FAM83D-B-like isoform X1 [Harpia harpyja]|uniref:protein FAM83D-B-like isoform X1 n=1 Tax=Harpia harpyja TaxID=202280 RepID=UPI0022B1306B|nr:protein FAM83D-B-like isoform X1 [Harpia harpyja]
MLPRAGGSPRGSADPDFPVGDAAPAPLSSPLPVAARGRAERRLLTREAASLRAAAAGSLPLPRGRAGGVEEPPARGAGPRSRHKGAGQDRAGPRRAMANPSQCLEEGAGRWPPRPPGPYSEAQRLALEELVAGGPEALRAFLRREQLPPFLSEPEVQAIARGALPPAAAPEPAGEPSPGASLDASSLTYFPERSDLEPPALELGWPGFASGAFRGLTRVEAHFQPGCGESIYGCKEAVRRQIRSARQMIALVMDSFTDTDIFKDLLEACSQRQVKAYILLDQSSFSHFLKMCKDLGVDLEREKLIRIRNITGKTYYTRSGAKIVGKVREKFMLIDGIRVTTGSYSFTWTDGKLNSSNILILSGPAVAHFDLEFRILYARSKPINLKELPSCKKNKVLDQLVRITVASRDLTRENFLRMEFLYLRAFVGNLKWKRSWLHAAREAVYVSNNAMHASPPLTKRNGSLVMRPHWIIER